MLVILELEFFPMYTLVGDTPFLQQCGVEDLILRVGGETSWSNTCLVLETICTVQELDFLL